MRTESVVSIVLALLGTALFSILLWYGLLKSTAYVALLSVLALVCLVLHGFSRIRELDLKNLRMKLDRMEKVKEDIFAKEKDLQKVSVQLAKIIAYNNAFHGRIGSHETFRLSNKWYRLQTEELLDLLGVREKERDRVLRYYTAMDRVDQVKDNPEEAAKENAKLVEMIKSDLGVEEK